MEQKLHHLLYSLSSRAAWIILGSSAAFWLICLTGILTPPVSAPPNVALFWFYVMLMLALASGIAAVGAAAVLMVRRRQVYAAAGGHPAAANDDGGGPDDAGRDQLAGLGAMMDDPENLAASAAAEDTAADAGRPPDITLQEPAPTSRNPVVPPRSPRRKPRNRHR